MPVNGLRLFRLFGVTVFLHWSWAMGAAYEMYSRAGTYSSLGWNLAEYVALFAIVLTHEYGHAMACRSVGGRAERIILWPFGGVAFVSPPPRPGAVLWSIAAGPLVNVALLPLCWPFLYTHPTTDLTHLAHNVAVINVVLLVFNLLPVYPLDGGQIFQSLLWFVIGRANSLAVASAIGVAGAVAFAAFCLYEQSYFGVAMAAFVGFQSVSGWKQSVVLRRRAAIVRRAELTCPSCGTHPPAGPYWTCPGCRNPIDGFASAAGCPTCGTAAGGVACLDCGTHAAYPAWFGSRVAVMNTARPVVSA